MTIACLAIVKVISLFFATHISESQKLPLLFSKHSFPTWNLSILRCSLTSYQMASNPTPCSITPTQTTHTSKNECIRVSQVFFVVREEATRIIFSRFTKWLGLATCLSSHTAKFNFELVKAWEFKTACYSSSVRFQSRLLNLLCLVISNITKKVVQMTVVIDSIFTWVFKFSDNNSMVDSSQVSPTQSTFFFFSFSSFTRYRRPWGLLWWVGP